MSPASMGKLYIAATPIGNLSDISARTLDTLKSCEGVVCEDTRVTRKLLSHFGLSKPVYSLHAHSGRARAEAVVGHIQKGETLVYVSDAGTPGLSDPGALLVEMCGACAIEVSPLPGPSALAAALSVCHFPVTEFVFLGFPPRKEGALREKLTCYMCEEQTIIVYESPRRLAKTLRVCYEVLGDRPVCIGREMTKVHEEFIRGTLASIADRVSGPVKGEVTILIGPPVFQAERDALTLHEAVDTMVRLFRISRKEAVKYAARITGRDRNEYYRDSVDGTSGCSQQ